MVVSVNHVTTCVMGEQLRRLYTKKDLTFSFSAAFALNIFEKMGFECQERSTLAFAPQQATTSPRSPAVTEATPDFFLLLIYFCFTHSLLFAPHIRGPPRLRQKPPACYSLPFSNRKLSSCGEEVPAAMEYLFCFAEPDFAPRQGHQHSAFVAAELQQAQLVCRGGAGEAVGGLMGAADGGTRGRLKSFYPLLLLPCGHQRDGNREERRWEAGGEEESRGDGRKREISPSQDL